MHQAPASDESERSYLVVQTNAVPGREAEFNDWYDNQHLADVLAIPGFVAAQRFGKSAVQREGSKAARDYEWEYLALYEVEGDPAAALAGLDAAVAAGMYLSPAMQKQSIAVVYSPRGPKITVN